VEVYPKPITFGFLQGMQKKDSNGGEFTALETHSELQSKRFHFSAT